MKQNPLSYGVCDQVSRPEGSSHAFLPPEGVTRQEEKGWGAGQGGKGMDAGIRKKKDSIFAIAKGGWQVPPLRAPRGKGQVWM